MSLFDGKVPFDYSQLSNCIQQLLSPCTYSTVINIILNRKGLWLAPPVWKNIELIDIRHPIGPLFHDCDLHDSGRTATFDNVGYLICFCVYLYAFR